MVTPEDLVRVLPPEGVVTSFDGVPRNALEPKARQNLRSFTRQDHPLFRNSSGERCTFLTKLGSMDPN